MSSIDNGNGDIIYGILTKRIQINQKCYIFSPMQLVKGILLSDTSFTDELGNDYFVLGSDDDYNQISTYEQDEYYIGWHVEESNLIDAYPDMLLENAKMAFFEEFKNSCVFAYLDEHTQEFKFITLKLDVLYNSLCDCLTNNSSNINIECENVHSNIVLDNGETLKYGEAVMVFEEKDFDKFLEMLNNKDYSKLIEAMKKYKDTLTNGEELINDFITSNAEKEIVIDNKDVEEKDIKNDIDVQDLYLTIKKKIIDQDEALKDIVTAIKMDQYAKHPSERSRCFIIGPTGSGKTKTLECLSEYLNKPFIKIDTTQLTTPGYIGGHIEDQLARLVNLTGGDIKKAENGIVVFDEIDKKCNTRDELFGKGFLFTLLPFLDGTDYVIGDNHKKQIFNTSNLTVFASGSFLDVIKNHALEKAPLGFNTQIANDEGNKSKLDPEEIFKKSGMPDEFIGRFPVIVQLDELGLESLKKILNESEISQLKAEKRKFNCLGVDLSWEEKYVEAVAKEAKKLNKGARSLKKIVERTIKYMRWEILTNPEKYKEATLLEETVNNPKVYKLK